MISTAVDLLERSKASMFNPRSMIMAKLVYEARNQDEEVFAKLLYDYAAHLIAYTASEMMEALLTEDEMSDLNATIKEIDEMGEILNGK